MKETTAELIKGLAEQLGTTAEMLWGVLLAQAPITGSVQLVICLGMMAATGWVTWVVYRKTTVVDEDADPYGPPWEEFAPPLWMGVILLVVVTTFALGEMVPSIAAAFINPEYWALQEILKAR